ncbi:arginine--tRNA ligase [Candidatus Peregrinibacteria bacterium]|nr:arginine--tRNA ligase [Candidatus Peregrinibacteria bacterium]MBI5254834.1 arginine--tRNA ligase [Candidatus Falkowbacteria bacterium]
MQKIKEQLAKLLQQAGFEVDASDFVLPPDIKMGDLALPCFGLAKKFKKSPAEIGMDILQGISHPLASLTLWRSGPRQVRNDNGVVDRAEIVGPYVNFTFKRKWLLEQILCSPPFAPSLAGLRVGKMVQGDQQKVMVEYSQPNTHKEFHVGHLRNACLGAALVNILRTTGSKVITANYIGDTGVHVAKCLWYLERNNPELVVEKGQNKAEYLGKIYSEAVRLIAEKPELMVEIADVQSKLESGDRKLLKLWKKTKKWSMNDFERIYKVLGNKFDKWFWESEEEKNGRKLLGQIIKEGKIKEIKKSEGALIADLQEYGLDVLVLIKSDGNVLYGAKDLSLGIKKFEKYKVDKSIYVVDVRQTLYLKQIFKMLDLLGYSEKEKAHVSYDFVTLPEGAMASRKGNVVSFDKLFNEVLDKAKDETKTRHADWPQKLVEQIAQTIALSAIKFWILKYENNSVIVFDVNKATAFDGDTGPYVLYTIARINSLFEKSAAAKLKPKSCKLELLAENIERELVLKIGMFNDAIKKAKTELDPSGLCKYLLELGQLFNNFYQKCRVIGENPELAGARLFLSNNVKDVLTKGLRLLNIKDVQMM